MTTIRWERFPLIAQSTTSRLWLQSQSDLNLAHNTIEAYGRALEDFFSFCLQREISPQAARRDDIAHYVQYLSLRPNLRSMNSSTRQRKSRRRPSPVLSLRGCRRNGRNGVCSGSRVAVCRIEVRRDPPLTSRLYPLAE
jgi:hypothetical protein